MKMRMNEINSEILLLETNRSAKQQKLKYKLCRTILQGINPYDCYAYILGSCKVESYNLGKHLDSQNKYIYIYIWMSISNEKRKASCNESDIPKIKS